MPDSDKTATERNPDPVEEGLAFAPIHELAERIRTGALTPGALLDLYLARIDRHDRKLHAFVAVYEKDARIAADLADRAIRAGQWLGPLHGIPIALKDLLDIEG
ncbi:MAG: amidase family protein, partial [Dongiaceae bacterium]